MTTGDGARRAPLRDCGTGLSTSTIKKAVETATSLYFLRATSEVFRLRQGIAIERRL